MPRAVKCACGAQVTIDDYLADFLRRQSDRLQALGQPRIKSSEAVACDVCKPAHAQQLAAAAARRERQERAALQARRAAGAAPAKNPEEDLQP